MGSTRILEGVLNVLAERGIGALSVRSVAAAADVSPAQVQYYYRTKNDLVRAGFDYVGEQFDRDLASAECDTVADYVAQWLPLDEHRDRRARVWIAYTSLAVNDEKLRMAAEQLDSEIRTWFTTFGMSDAQAGQLFAMIDGVTTQCLMLPMPQRKRLVDQTIGNFLEAMGHPG